jgi:hypothetical protein
MEFSYQDMLEDCVLSAWSKHHTKLTKTPLGMRNCDAVLEGGWGVW